MKVSGIYITDKSIRLVQAAKTRGGQAVIREEKIDIASLEEENIPKAIRSYLKQGKITFDYLILGIPRTQVSIKYLALPATSDSEIKNMLGFELNNLFPYKTEELIYDHAVIDKGSDDYSQLILAAAPREIILKQISVLKKSGLAPDSVNISTVSLFNQFLGQNRPSAGYLLINLDDTFLEMVFINQGKLEFSRSLNFEASAGFQDLFKDIELTITVLKDKGNSPDRIILSGAGQDLEGFAVHLRQKLSLEVEIDKTIDVLKGMLLKGNGRSLKINLLPEELRVQKLRNKKRRSVFIFAALLLLNLSLVANIAFFGIKARREYLSLLKSEINKIYPQASLLQERIADLDVIRGFVNSGRLNLGLLSEVYRASPEGINLSSLDIASQKTPRVMVIAGQAKTPEIVYKFANTLRESPLIKKADVNFVTKTSPEAQEQMVNFEIKSVF